MKTLKKLLSILLCIALVISVTACGKKKDPATDPAKTDPGSATTTVTLPTVDELYDEFKGQLEPVTSVISNEGVKDGGVKNLEVPDGVYAIDLSSNYEINMFGMMNMTADSKINGNVEFIKNIAHGSVSKDIKSTSITTGFDPDEADEPEDKNDSDTVEFYADNTGDNMVFYLKSAKDNEWTKATITQSSLQDSTADIVSEYVPENDDKLFTDTDKFFKDHSQTKAASEGYALDTEFTWADFYTYYKNDFQKLSEGIGKGMLGLFAEEDESADYFNKFFESGSGSFKIVTTYDTNKKVRRIEICINDLAMSMKAKSNDGTEQDALGVKIPILKLSLIISETTSGAISIPNDVVKNAKDQTVDDYDNLEDWNWDYDNYYDYDDYYDGYGYGLDEEFKEKLNDVSKTDDGKWQLDLGGYYLPLEFDKSWNATNWDYYISTEPVPDKVIVNYSCSYVDVDDVDDLQSIIDEIKDDWGEDCGAELVEISVGDNTRKSYAFSYKGMCNRTYLYIAGSQGEYYLEVSIEEYGTTNDSLKDKVAKYGIVF